MQTTNLSIEQVELIRRLRNSGATVQQISEAYQVFDRIDKDFGSFGLVKVTQSTHPLPSSKHLSTSYPISTHQNCQNAMVISSDQNHQDRKKKAASPIANEDPGQLSLQGNNRTHIFSNSKVTHSHERPPYQSPSFSSILTEVATHAKSTSLEREGVQNATCCDQDYEDSKAKASSPLSNEDSSQPSLQVRSLIQNHSKVIHNHNGPLFPSPSFSSVLTEVAANARSTLLGKDVRFDGITHSPQLINLNSTAHRQSYPDQYISSSSLENSLGNLNYNDSDSSPSISSTSMMSEVKGFDNVIGGMNEFLTHMGPKPSESAVREAGRCMLLSANPDQVKTLIRKCCLSIPMFDPLELCSLFGLSEVGIKQFLNGLIPHEGEYGLQIVDWFINTLSKTDWFISDVLKYSQQIMMRKQIDVPEAVEFTPRKERFTFRDMHLEVLESHFKKDRYPSLKEKEMIANECNIKMAIVANCELKEKERVTHINVDHWFRNKRKEIIRRARLENVDATKVILPSRVKSARMMLSEPSTSDTVEQQSVFSLNAVPSPVHLYSSTQANDADRVASVNMDQIKQDPLVTQLSEVSGSPQPIRSENNAPIEPMENGQSSHQEDLSWNVTENQTMTEITNAESTNGIKIEPLSEGENND